MKSLRTLAVAALIFGAALAGGAAAKAEHAERALATATAARTAGDPLSALLAARSAAESFVPWGRTHVRALEELDSLAREAEGRGDQAMALAARNARFAAEREIRSGPAGGERGAAERLGALLGVSMVMAAGLLAATRIIRRGSRGARLDVNASDGPRTRG